MIFPYVDDEPVIPLEIRNSSKDFIPFHGYLDSGAGVSVFHIDVAEILGINIYKGNKFYLTVGDGAKIESYLHKLWVRFTQKEFLADISPDFDHSL